MSQRGSRRAVAWHDQVDPRGDDCKQVHQCQETGGGKLLISAAKSSGLSAVTSRRFGIGTASVIDVLWEWGRFVWSRLERRGAACRSLARRRAGPSRTEAQQPQELWCGAPGSAGAMPVAISVAVLRVSSRAPRASREPAGSPTAPRQPHALRFARSPRRSRRPAKNSNHRRGGSRDAVAEMMAPVRRHLFRCWQQPQIIQNLFYEKHVQYTA